MTPDPCDVIDAVAALVGDYADDLEFGEHCDAALAVHGLGRYGAL